MLDRAISNGQFIWALFNSTKKPLQVKWADETDKLTEVKDIILYFIQFEQDQAITSHYSGQSSTQDPNQASYPKLMDLSTITDSPNHLKQGALGW